MNRKIALLAGILMGAGGCGKTEEVAVTIVVFDAEALVNEFKDNEVAADAKYKGRSVGVTGSVREIGKEKGTFSDQAYLDLGGRARVRCYFDKDKEAQFQGLKKDDKVFVVGTCQGVHVSFRERVAGESLDDKFKKLFGVFVFITLENCDIRPPINGKP